MTFIPLSPKSSRTLRHHREASRKSDQKDGQEDADPSGPGSSNPRSRRLSDPSSDRPLMSLRRPGAYSPSFSDAEDITEVLPDRFDSEGRPLDPLGLRESARWHSRQGDFAYRSPRGQQGWNVRGQWGVAGTDNEAVERIVRDVTGAMEGRGGWLGLIGDVLGGSLLPQEGGGAAAVDSEAYDPPERGTRRDDRRRGYRDEDDIKRRKRSSRKIDTHDRDPIDDDYDDDYDATRHRRRRRKSE